MKKITFSVVLCMLCFSQLAHSKPTHEIQYCTEGKKSDCSDCRKETRFINSDKTTQIIPKPKDYVSYLINKDSKTIMVHEYDASKKFRGSYLLKECTIFDMNNWNCDSYGEGTFWKYKSHAGYIEYLFKDSARYSNVVRVCGKRI